MKISVIGGNGQLGRDVVSEFIAAGDEVFPLTHADIDLTSMDSVTACLSSNHPDLIVNTAAMHHVENCELEPAKAFAVNAIGAKNLAVVARGLEAKLMHISTDYVFDGGKKSPYVEDDLPLPLNVYGNSKLSGENFVRAIAPKHFVLRTSALYGHHPCRAKGGKNFVDLMLKLARERGKVRVVDCEIISPTSTLSLAKQIVALGRSDAYDLYHATGEGSCSWFEFAREVFAMADTRTVLEVACPDEFPMKVLRPTYSVLENAALKRTGLNLMRPWQESLEEYLHSQAFANN